MPLVDRFLRWWHRPRRECKAKECDVVWWKGNPIYRRQINAGETAHICADCYRRCDERDRANRGRNIARQFAEDLRKAHE